MFYKGITAHHGMTLKDLAGIVYKNRAKVPVQITVEEDRISILAYVDYDRFMQGKFEGLKKVEDFTYADSFERGVKRFWEKRYDLSYCGLGSCDVDVTFVRKGSPEYPQGQRCFKVRKARISKTSFVSSPPTRLFWGLFAYLSPESAMLNWSLKHPGTINMQKYKNPSGFMRVSAHEFGHVLGIGDAYEAHYRFFYKAPGTEDFMMYHNTCVQPQELMMVLRAHQTGRMQYFPIKFSLKRYMKGMKKMVSENRVFTRRQKKN